MYYEIIRVEERSSIGWIIKAKLKPGYASIGLAHDGMTTFKGFSPNRGNFDGNPKMIDRFKNWGPFCERKLSQLSSFFAAAKFLGCTFNPTSLFFSNEFWNPWFSTYGNAVLTSKLPETIPRINDMQFPPFFDPYNERWELIVTKL